MINITLHRCYNECMKIRNSETMKRGEHIMSVKDIERRINMKERLTIRKRGQVTLPKSFIERFGLEEGDSLELEVNNKGEVIVVPMVQVPASQKWFWDNEWQQGEQEAEEDIKAGRVRKFDNVNDLIADLESDD